jgi:hypothetical protein
MRLSIFLTVVVLAIVVQAGVNTRLYVSAQQPNPRQQPGAPITIYPPDQHDLYDGHFVISANRVHMVGSLNDSPVGTTRTTTRNP